MTVDKSRPYWKIKRFGDIVISGLALVGLSPIFAGVALAVYIDDPKGSPIFKQVRVGKDGKEFTVYKFRSMCVNAPELLEETAKQLGCDIEGSIDFGSEDPRITKVGGFIRKTSLDELPQFFNVLKGDMSVVGPRPSLPSEVMNYADDSMRDRLIVKPGITCIWQVAKNKNAIDVKDRVEMDREYIRKCSVLTDSILILRTIKSVVTCKND